MMARRQFLSGLATMGAISALPGARSVELRRKTDFQLACMTLPYSRFTFGRALQGIASAGFRFVAWGTTHQENGREIPLIAPDATVDTAQELGKKCRDAGLEPVMMFSITYPEAREAPEVFRARIKQASAAGIAQLLTFGHTKGGNRALWVKRFRELAPMASDAGVMIVIKQHGGETGTGEACAEVVREINHPSIKVNYDAGNVLDYLNLDPIPDLQKCAAEVRSFCIKDHRNFPRDEDCGPGYGEIDHYKLLHAVAWSGERLPLACENISAPLLPRPSDPAGIDREARRAREFLETVVRGLHQMPD